MSKIRFISALKTITFSLLFYASGIVLYNLITPGFIDHASALVSITSWVSLFEHKPIYHSLTDPAAYNLMYGPWLYIFHWPAFITLGGSFIAAKIMGSMAFLGSMILIYSLAHKLREDASPWLFLIYFIPFILKIDDFFYGNRADSFLLFLSLLAAWVYFHPRLNDNIKLIITAMIMGICFNVKIHSVLFIAPFVAGQAFQSLKKMSLGSLVFLLTCLIPWTIIPEQWPTYLQILKQLSKEMSLHDEGRKVFLLNAWTAVFFFIFWKGRIPKNEKVFATVTFICIGVANILACRVGSGTNQTIPLIALFFVFFQWAEPKKIELKYTMIILFLLGLMILNFSKSQKEMFTYLGHRQNYIERQQDINSLIKDLPAQSVYYAFSNSNYPEASLRPEIYFKNKGSRLIIDSVTMMENLHSNFAFPEKAYDELKNCQAAAYAIEDKEGDVHLLHSFYPPYDIIFPKAWNEAYQKHYRTLREGQYYRLRQCQPL